jgi:hypothetical protein
MIITIENTVGDVIKYCPNYKEIFKKYWGKSVPDMILKLAKPLKIKNSASRAGWSQEQINAFLKDVNDDIAKNHKNNCNQKFLLY